MSRRMSKVWGRFDISTKMGSGLCWWRVVTIRAWGGCHTKVHCVTKCVFGLGAGQSGGWRWRRGRYKREWSNTQRSEKGWSTGWRWSWKNYRIYGEHSKGGSHIQFSNLIFEKTTFFNKERRKTYHRYFQSSSSFPPGSPSLLCQNYASQRQNLTWTDADATPSLHHKSCQHQKGVSQQA